MGIAGDLQMVGWRGSAKDRMNKQELTANSQYSLLPTRAKPQLEGFPTSHQPALHWGPQRRLHTYSFEIKRGKNIVGAETPHPSADPAKLGTGPRTRTHPAVETMRR